MTEKTVKTTESRIHAFGGVCASLGLAAGLMVAWLILLLTAGPTATHTTVIGGLAFLAAVLVVVLTRGYQRIVDDEKATKAGKR